MKIRPVYEREAYIEDETKDEKRRKMIARWVKTARKMREKGERKREHTWERSAGFKEPTVVKEPSSSLHLDTHKYVTFRAD